jgi:hypothetical protein
VANSFSSTGPWTVEVINPDGQASNVFGFTVIPPTVTIPHPPTNLSGVATASLVSLAWTDNSDNESGFQVERAPSGAGDFTQIATTGPGVAAYVDQAVTEGTSYDYRVRAYDSAGGSAYSNTLTIVVQRSGECTVTVNASPGAGGTASVTSGGTTGACGRSVTVTASPASGYSFNNWTLNGSPLSSNASYTFSLSTTEDLVANFTLVVLPTVSLGASPSSITVGQSATLTWSSSNAVVCVGTWVGNQQVATSGTHLVTPSTTTTYTIYCQGASGPFVNAATTVVVTAPAPSIGLVSPSSFPSSTVDQTMTITGANFQIGAFLTLTPAVGSPFTSNINNLRFVNTSRLDYQFSSVDVGSWSVSVTNPDGRSSSPWPFRVTPPVSSYQINVWVSPFSPSSPSAGGVVNGAGSYASGSLVTLVALPNPGYRLGSWMKPEDGSIFSPTAPDTLAFNATIDRTIVANFESTNPSLGSLVVVVVGLPSYGAAAIAVTGPNGYSATVNQTGILTGLAPGIYTLTPALNLNFGGHLYVPDAQQSNLQITAGSTSYYSMY